VPRDPLSVKMTVEMKRQGEDSIEGQNDRMKNALTSGGGGMPLVQGTDEGSEKKNHKMQICQGAIGRPRSGRNSPRDSPD